MKIAQNSCYYTEWKNNISLPKNAAGKNSTVENNFQKNFILSKRAINETENLSLDQFKNKSKISVLGINASLTGSKFYFQNYHDIDVNQDANSESIAEDTSINLAELKLVEMEDLLKKHGINGRVVSTSVETVPQKYALHYIELEVEPKNIAVIEFENGEMFFTEAETNVLLRGDELGKVRSSLGMNDKLSVSELKKAFAKFFNVEKLKDFSILLGLVK